MEKTQKPPVELCTSDEYLPALRQSYRDKGDPRAYEADRIICRDGMFLVRKNGSFATHPAVRISLQSWRDVRVFAQEFGLTPSSATRVRATTPVEEADDDKESAEDFLFKGGKVIGQI